jgi:hypothetical protein
MKGVGQVLGNNNNPALFDLTWVLPAGYFLSS